MYSRFSVGRAALTVTAFMVALLVLLPIAWLILSAFRPQDDILAAPYSLPQNLTIQNFLDLHNIPGFGKSLRNSFLVAFVTTICTALAALPVGYLLSRYHFRGQRLLRLVSLSGYLFAPAILALPYFQFLSFLGLVDSIWGIVFAHIAFCLPFSIALSELIFRSVPLSIEEVAMLDGIGIFARIVFIVTPAARYQIAALLLLVFTISWKEFFFAFLISSGFQTQTLPVMLASLYGGESTHWHLVCALSTVLILPSVLLLSVGRIRQIVPLISSESRG